MTEENAYRHVCEDEYKHAQLIYDYIKKTGWKNIPVGEREEATLSLCQHYYTIGDLETTSNLLVEAMEAGIRDPLVYYAYFIVGLGVGEFEAALNGYKVAIETIAELSLVPTHYQIETVLVHNRFETRCKAIDTRSQKPVLVKILRNPPESVRENLRKSLALRNEKFIRKIEFNEDNQHRPCLVTEYVEGTNLGEYIGNNEALDIAQALQLAIQIIGIVAKMHEERATHGHLVPANIIVLGKDVKIINTSIFPLAEWPTPITQKELIEFSYTAPELFSARSGPTFCSDVYSLGTILYYIITGYLPVPLHSENISKEVWPIIKKATELNPELRHQNAGELLADLTALLAKQTNLRIAVYPKEPIPKESDTLVLSSGDVIKLPEKFLYRKGCVYCDLDNSEMILVENGPFVMGSNERDSEGPVHEVQLDSYLIDKYPVTNEQYSRFLEYMQQSNDHSMCHPQEAKGKDHSPKGWQTPEYEKFSDNPKSPVIFVDWWDAWAYARWAGKTLPTEAQWEKAARGTDQRKYPWGNEEPTPGTANFGNHVSKTTVVGSYPIGASPYGCMDMAGNVWEWTLDTYDKTFYTNSSQVNPVNITGKPSRTLRGGSWNDSSNAVRVCVRSCWINIVRYSYIGFRCVYSLGH